MTCKARRGDFAVVRQEHSYSYRDGSRRWKTWALGTVTSVTRDGLVKEVRFPDGSTAGSSKRTGHLLGCQIVSASRVDAPAVLSSFPDRWDYSGPRAPWEFENLDAVRAYFQPFLARAGEQAQDRPKVAR